MKKLKIQPEQMTDTDLMETLEKADVQIEEEIEYSIKGRLESAKGEKPMKQLFGTHIQSGEIAFLAGDTGAGKTLLAFQITDNLTKGLETLEQPNESAPLKVLYYDFELSNQSLLKRYDNYQFNFDNFLCPDINKVMLANDGVFSIDIIRNDIEKFNADVVVIDNISAIALKSTQDQDTSLQLMKNIKFLNLEKGTTFIILAHTPKLPGSVPLNVNHMAGSKHLTNFADSVCFIGKSSKSVERRYIKQVKSRNAELTDQVLLLDIVKDDYLHFDFAGYDSESSHLDMNPERDTAKRNELIEIAEEIIGKGSIAYNDFLNAYAKETGKTIESGKKVHKQLKINNIIIKDSDGRKWIINRNEIPEKNRD